MLIAIHQPDYIPYLGYFYKISKVDKFVFLDNCQYSNDNMHNWNRIKTPQGELKLKIPVDYVFKDPINSVRTRDELSWKEKHLKTIQMNYSRSEYYLQVFPKLEELLFGSYRNLADLNIEINSWIIRSFGFQVRLLKSSDMDINSFSEKRVIDICNLLGGDTYISGNGARAYQEEENFKNRGIKLVYTDYRPIEYKQLWDKVGFLKNLSILDFIFNCGFNWNYVIQMMKDLD